MEINREDQTKTFDVQLAEMPLGTADEGNETSSEETSQPEKTTVLGGVAVTTITEDIRTALNLPKDVQGAAIANIDADRMSSNSSSSRTRAASAAGCLQQSNIVLLKRSFCASLGLV